MGDTEDLLERVDKKVAADVPDGSPSVAVAQECPNPFRNWFGTQMVSKRQKRECQTPAARDHRLPPHSLIGFPFVQLVSRRVHFSDCTKTKRICPSGFLHCGAVL